MDLFKYIPISYSKNLLTAKVFFASNLNLFLLLWLGWILFPLFLSGFVSDDAYNSQIRGVLLYADISLFDRIVSEISYWFDIGRFNPLNWIFWYVYFYLFPSLLLFKFFVFFLIYLNLIYFSKILEFITQSKLFSYYIVFMVPILFQFRYWHDPFLAFASIPLACLLLFVSLHFLIRYLETGRKSYYSYFVLIFLISLLSYELSYISPLFYFLISYLKNKSLKQSVLLIVIPITLIVFHVIIKTSFSSPLEYYPGVILSLDLSGVAEAFYIQIISTIPFTWKLAEGFSNLSLLKIGILDLIPTAIFSCLLVSLLTSLISGEKNINEYRTKFLITFSFLLIVIPAFVVAISGHQSELVKAGIGYGYLPVFFQYFGLATLILLIIRKITPSLILSTSIWFAFFVIISFTRLENYHVVKESNIVYKYPRDLLGSSIKQGLLNGVTEDDLIIIHSKYPSDDSWFYSMMMDKKINVCSINISSENITISNKKVSIFNEKFGTDRYHQIRFPYCLKYKNWNNIFGLSYHHFAGYTSGEVIFTSLVEVDKNQKNERFKFKEYKIYNILSKKITSQIGEKYYDFNKLSSIDKFAINDSYFRLLPFLLVDKISLSFSGLYAEEGTRDSYLRWSSGKSKIIIHNDNLTVQSRVLNFAIIRPNNDNLPLEIRQGENIVKKVVSNYKEFSLQLLLEPGETIIEISSELQSINNGDPRDIVFGIANYTLSLSK